MIDILLIDEKIKNNLNYVDIRFYFLDSSHIITRYKNLLSKPILRSRETSHKSDIINEYLEMIKVTYIDLRSMPQLEEILYYMSDEDTRDPCKNCNGRKFEECEDYITCSECGCCTEKIYFVSTSNGGNSVTPRKIYKKKIDIINR